MSSDVRHLAAPSDLLADIKHRADGDFRMYGVHLRWRIGDNRPDHGSWPPPSDWDEGNAPYPHIYEVWVDGEARQTVYLYWPAWDWSLSNAHWVDLGEEPHDEYRVKVRAKIDDDRYSEFTDEVTVRRQDAVPWTVPALDRGAAPAAADADVARPRHGTVGFPRSRAAAAIRDEDTSTICVEARKQNSSTTWQEVLPGAERMLASYPWNYAMKYLEYRKFFEGSTVASTGNEAFKGLDLTPGSGLSDWPTTELDASDAVHAFSYDYTAYHVGETWSHRWFITRQGWDPADGLTWEDIDPMPFLVEVHGAPRQQDSTTWEFTTLPRRSGRAAVVQVWGGHGGPDTPGGPGDNGGKSGEFFLSTCDLQFTG